MRTLYTQVGGPAGLSGALNTYLTSVMALTFLSDGTAEESLDPKI